MNEQIRTKQKILSVEDSLKQKIKFLEKENLLLKSKLHLKDQAKDHISVLDNIPLALINLDPEGNLIFGNEFFFSLFNLEADFLELRTNISNFSSLWGTTLIEKINFLINENTAFDIETQLKHQAPERIYKARGISINKENGDIISYLIIIGDITQRKKAEKQLIHEKERAQESDALKTAFIANISHEIRTPINHIMGFLELLSLDDYDTETRDEYRGIIYRSSQSLLGSIENIIDIARIKSGQIVLKNSETNLNELFSEIEELAKDIAVKNNKQSLEIRKRIPANSVDYCINIDKFRLKQTIKNIVENAIKFTNEGFVEFGYKPTREGKLYIFIKDTGIGIEKENYEKIFENFRQVDYRTTRVVEGSGLGLSISKGLTDLLKAKLELRSVIDKGSVFSILFPKIECKFNKNNNLPKEIFDTGF
jgi:signal transduction histidine kinase